MSPTAKAPLLTRARNAVAALAAALLMASPAAVQAQVRVASDITYARAATEAGQKALKLDLYTPVRACTGGCPVIIAIHGGGFVGGSREDREFRALVESAAARGYGVAMIQYRLVRDRPVLNGTSNTFLSRALKPKQQAMLASDGRRARQARAAVAAMEDTLSAIGWVARNGGQYGLDGRRVVLWGASAGAITALNVGYGADEMGVRPAARVAGVVNYWGQLMPPFSMDAGDPPMMMVHGAEDRTVKFRASRALAAQAQRKGVSTLYLPLAGVEHGMGKVDPARRKVQGRTIEEHTLGFIDSAFGGRVERGLRCVSDAAGLCRQGG